MRRALVQRWRASGQSLRSFARTHGIGERRLGRWCRSAAMEQAEPTGFVAVEVAPSPADAGGLTVRVRSGVTVEVRPGFDPALLRAILAALG